MSEQVSSFGLGALFVVVAVLTFFALLRWWRR